VTDILITHIYSDHSGGLTADGRRVFPNATVQVSQAESDYWLSEANLAKALSDGKLLALDRKFFLEARTKLGPYVEARKVRTFANNAEVVPGIRAMVGPGHTYYVLESQGQKMLFAGDMIHAPRYNL
jgi:glyoxylase-like metal-dependent hydrolase (beta-lactamase superfamily II)